MMINSCFEYQQDTFTIGNTVLKGSIGVKPDSVCYRNSIADISFFNPNNFVTKIDLNSSIGFPFNFIEKNRQIISEEREFILKHLKQGQEISATPFHNDWIVIIIVVVAFLFSVIRTTTTKMVTSITRFFLFRRVKDTSARELGELFHWQSTILNLISFLVIGIFFFDAALYYNLVPEGKGGIIFWLISLGIIASGITIRHIICVITGQISGEREIFRQYLLSVYQFYRYSAFILLIIIILMSYTLLLPVKASIISGFVVLGMMYLLRILRLMVIFINRNISIFYFILYLCGLEILPVLISIKYFSGLV
jgi:hypothetical protein